MREDGLVEKVLRYVDEVGPGQVVDPFDVCAGGYGAAGRPRWKLEEEAVCVVPVGYRPVELIGLDPVADAYLVG